MKTLRILGQDLISFGEAKPGKDVPNTSTRFLNPRYEPSNITNNTTVIQVMEAIRNAEAGDFTDLARFYRDVLLSDDHIQSCVNTRKLAVLSQTLNIQPYNKQNADDVNLAAAMNRARMDCENWNVGMISLLDSSCIFPVSVMERLVRPADPAGPDEPQLQYTLKRFVPVNPQLLCWKWAYLSGGVGFGTASAIQLANVGADDKNALTNPENSPYNIDLEKWEPWLKLWPVDAQGRIIYDVTHAEYLDPKRHVVHRGHMLINFRDNWGGPGRALLIWYLLRGLGREWFARGMERYGSPWPVAYTDANDPSAVALLEQAFDLAKKIGGLIVDETSRVELKEAMVQGMAQGYETFHRLCNEAISYHITGLRESQKPAGLNAGQSNFSGSVREDVRIFDQMMLAETCERQVANPLRDMNGLKGRVKYVWGGLSDADAKTFADFLKTMKEGGFEADDASLPIVNERTGMTWKKATPPPALVPPGQPAKPGTVPDKDGDDDEEKKLETLVAKVASRLGSVNWLSARPVPTPVDDVVAKHEAALAEAFRGSMAPVRQIILNSTSRADAEAKLKVLFADWPVDRIAGIVEQALQICAAKGLAEK
jgi:phage gp29-like protein